MNQKLAIVGSVAALVSAFFPIYLHFAEPAPQAKAGQFTPRTTSPGFNCANATTVTEITICQWEELARLDRDLNANYDTLIFGMDEATSAKLRDAQGAWRRARDGCRTDATCIEAAYLVRLETLSDLLVRQ
ncbi:MAG: lysozyme inhibitor LprI family protein [Pseudomonadota bacterium]